MVLGSMGNGDGMGLVVMPPGMKEGKETVVKMILLGKLAKRETRETVISQVVDKKGVDPLDTPLTAE